MVKKGARGVTLQLPKAPIAVKAKAGSPAAHAGNKRKRSRGRAEPRSNDAPARSLELQGRDEDGGSRRGGGQRRKGGGKGKGRQEVSEDGEAATEGRSRSAIRSALQKQRRREEQAEKALPKKQRKRLEKKRKLKEKRQAPKTGRPEASVSAAVGQSQPAKKTKKKKLKASEVIDAMCRRGHTMHKRTMNPAGYFKPAACDKCGLANLSKKCQYFYHCSFCKWDICPDCILPWRQEHIRPPKYIREKLKEEREGGDGKIAAKAKKKDDERLGKEIDEAEFSKDRRQIWLPTELTSVNRAPLEQNVVSDWVEGVPL